MTPCPTPVPLVSKLSPAQLTEVPPAVLAVPSTGLAAPSTAVEGSSPKVPSTTVLTDEIFPASFRPQTSDLAAILRTVQVMEQQKPPGACTPRAPPHLASLVPWTAPVRGTPGSVLVLHLPLPPPVFDPNRRTLESLLVSLELPRLGLLPPPYLRPLKRDAPKGDHGSPLYPPAFLTFCPPSIHDRH